MIIQREKKLTSLTEAITEMRINGSEFMGTKNKIFYQFNKNCLYSRQDYSQKWEICCEIFHALYNQSYFVVENNKRIGEICCEIFHSNGEKLCYMESLVHYSLHVLSGDLYCLKGLYVHSYLLMLMMANLNYDKKIYLLIYLYCYYLWNRLKSRS